MSSTIRTSVSPKQDQPPTTPQTAQRPAAAQIRDPVRTIAHILRATVIIVGVAALLWALSSAFVVIILAVILSTLLRGLGKELNHYTRLNMTIAVLLVFLAMVAVVCGLGYWAGPKFASEGQQLWAKLSHSLGSIQTMMGNIGIGSGAGGSGGRGGLAAGGLTHMLPGVLGQVASSTVGFLGAILVIVATAVYFAISPDMYITGIVHLTPVWYHERTRKIMIEMGHAMQGWMLGQLIDMIIVGLIVGGGLSLIGAPLPLALGVIAGLCTFIPYFGTIISAIPAVIVGATVSISLLAWVIGVFVVAHVVEGYIVAPFVQRRTVHLPPALTLLAMVLLVAVFNIFGVLIATPLMAVIMVGVTRVYVEDILGDPSGRKLTVRGHWYWFTPPDETEEQARRG